MNMNNIIFTCFYRFHWLTDDVNEISKRKMLQICICLALEHEQRFYLNSNRYDNWFLGTVHFTLEKWHMDNVVYRRYIIYSVSDLEQTEIPLRNKIAASQIDSKKKSVGCLCFLKTVQGKNRVYTKFKSQINI